MFFMGLQGMSYVQMCKLFEHKLAIIFIVISLKISFVCSKDKNTGPRSAVRNMSGYRCVSDCRSRGREFDPGPVPYFRGD